VPERARALAGKHKAEACASVEELVAKSDAVVVAATNDQLVPLTTLAVRAGKHVVVEKPAARRASELEPLVALAREKRVVVKVGFNHRFHPAAQKARAILDAGGCGDIMFIRGRYGHGGRIGYDKEWRADPEKSGGGELIDQGVHLIDLARWFLGAELTDVQGRVETYFWQMPVDDNAFLTLATAARQVAHLQVSCTEWKNMFSFEIYARHAKLHLEGLGGSYGPERLYHYAMRPEMGPPDATIYEYPPADRSWALEWADFARAVATGQRACGDALDALEALRVVDRVYGRG
jgi:predicted dehydrogenase